MREAIVAKFEEQRVALVAKIGENISFRRAAILEGDMVGSYMHGDVSVFWLRQPAQTKNWLNTLLCTLLASKTRICSVLKMFLLMLS